MKSKKHVCLQTRRAELLNALDGRTAVIPAGLPTSRNFPANQHPFRASSHFLHCVGQNLPGAVLILDERGACLYVERPDADDALWHGPRPTAQEWRATLDVKTAYLDELVYQSDAMVLPAMDPGSSKRISEKLNRPVSGGSIDPFDRPLAEAMVASRLCHDPWAIDQLIRAAQVTAEAHELARNRLRSGVSCQSIWGVMNGYFYDHGMTNSYNPIITPAGEVLHQNDLSAKMQAGDMVLLDVGAETGSGYAADVTRTWPVEQPMSPTQSAIHDVVSTAQDAAIALIKPGVEYREVHRMACLTLVSGLCDLNLLYGDPIDLVEENVHALFFPHGVGHLLGLDVHDMEDLGDLAGYAPGRRRSERFGWSFLRLDRPLQEGMLVTVEPGFYQVDDLQRRYYNHPHLTQFVNWSELSAYSDVRGLRVEDDILVTADGSRCLSQTTG
ncbi:MAG: Xaa-Pro aminopeptidase [Myxococcota bacterium]|nr:Xaa-Pro aminopeptidase [Myxococcota bacterium]